jgi:hypothetical protein
VQGLLYPLETSVGELLAPLMNKLWR